MNQNIPFTHQDVKDCHLGFTSSGNRANRKKRRSFIQKESKRPNYGKPVHHYQVEFRKDGSIKFIPHFYPKDDIKKSYSYVIDVTKGDFSHNGKPTGKKICTRKAY